LKARGDEFAIAPQIMAEFWNVSTRPASARGGYGLSVAETEHHLNVIERVCNVIPDSLKAPGSDLVIWTNHHWTQLKSSRNKDQIPPR
jgi:hypothetical protein